MEGCWSSRLGCCDVRELGFSSDLSVSRLRICEVLVSIVEIDIVLGKQQQEVFVWDILITSTGACILKAWYEDLWERG